MKMNKKTLKADSGKPFQRGEICSSGRSLVWECFLSPVSSEGGRTAAWSALPKAQSYFGACERKATGCRGGGRSPAR